MSKHCDEKVMATLSNLKLTPYESGLEWIARERVDVDEETADKLLNLVDALEEHDDVRAVYTNVA
jgi:transcriptional/translational regulatory protein YebC/TACO1